MRPFLLSLFLIGCASLPLSAAEPASESEPVSNPVEVAEEPASFGAPSAPTEAPASAAASDPESESPAPEAAPRVEAAAEKPSAPVVSPPAAPPVEAPAATPAPAAALVHDPRTEQLAERLAVMEQLLLGRQERETNLYRDTMRLVTTYGIAFAGVCVVGLLTAAFLNHRALIAVQNAFTRSSPVGASATENGLLPAPLAPVPGMERVHASGQRFQSRMTSLEQRLAELEHLAGRDDSAADAGAAMLVPPAGMEEAPAPPRRVVPRAMILVHKSQAQMNLGKLNEALATLDEAAALDAAKPEVHLARGQVLEKLGRLGDALHAYDSAVEADEANTNALLMKAGVLNRQERFTEALACYERALEVHRIHA